MNRTVLSVAIAAVVAGVGFPVQEAQAQGASDEPIEEVVSIGTRSSKPRSASDSPVPVDVISGEEFNAMGATADLTDNLQANVPSYNATPATGDGSAFVRPTSLRGMAPDQTLVLINGKRRHRSALLHFFAPAAGNGAHGVDIGMIPGIAIKSVEVLRDGAAAQYGSDAIAGVINFITKDNSEGGDVEIQWGQHYDGEDSIKFAANAGFEIGNNGFLSASIEYLDNDALSRGIQRPDAQALIDSGVSGVGADAPFGDTPLVQTWGRPQTEGTRIFVNGGVPVGDDGEFYFFGNYSDTEGRYRFFYRNPQHSSLVPLRDMGFTGLPAGYTPFLDGDQTDLSVVTGLTGVFANGTTYDFSFGYGENELDYFLNNTINQSLGLINGEPAQRDFDVGAYEQEEVNLNADFSTEINDRVNLAYGAEWREETFTIIAGEENAQIGAGSNGFGGIKTRDAGDFDRDNFAVYADLEHDISDQWLMQYALRYEDFSDFGSTTNGKIATRYSVNDRFNIRGAVSTGFHAPTPGQTNIRTTITTFDGVTGQQVEEGLVPSTSPLVQAVGGTSLSEEESTNISLGFTADVGDETTLTVDYYNIDVDDRIYRTGDIAVPGTTDQTISFYTNALDVEHEGVDIVVTSAHDWNDTTSTSISLAYGYNQIDVTGQTPVRGVNPVSEGIIEDIENNYPEHRWVLTTNTFFGDKWNLLARVKYFGEHYDERGRIDADVDPSAQIDSIFYVDMELGYQYNENHRFTLGATNIFDEYIDEIGPPNANRLSVGLQYPRRTAANYEGGAWYLRYGYRF